MLISVPMIRFQGSQGDEAVSVRRQPKLGEALRPVQRKAAQLAEVPNVQLLDGLEVCGDVQPARVGGKRRSQKILPRKRVQSPGSGDIPNPQVVVIGG